MPISRSSSRPVPDGASFNLLPSPVRTRIAALYPAWSLSRLQGTRWLWRSRPLQPGYEITPLWRGIA